MNFKQWLTSSKEERAEVAKSGKLAQKIAAKQAEAQARLAEVQERKTERKSR